MYVSSELQAPVIIKMLFLCFMKQTVTERLLVRGGGPSAFTLMVQN
jgi:hypothetical protein